MRRSKRFVSLVMVLVMVLSVVPFSVFEVSAVSDDSGSCGTNVTYTFTASTGTLTISGNGAMTDYYNNKGIEERPWNNYCSYVKKIIVDYGIRGIGENAFVNCNNLTNVEISNTVITLGYSSFSNCSSLQSVIMGCNCSPTTNPFKDSPNSLIIYGYSGSSSEYLANKYNIKFEDIGKNATGKCGDYANWEYDNSTKTLTISGIGDMYDFEYCSDQPWYGFRSNIEHINVGNNITRIGDNNFASAILSSITIGKSVKSIGKFAFEGIDGYTNLEEVKFPDNLEIIEHGAFCNHSKLATIEIPATVNSIDGMAFKNTAWLENQRNKRVDRLVIVNNIVIDGIETSGNVVIPDGIVNIAPFSFYCCTNLVSVTFSDSVQYIGRYAFRGCDNLVSVILSSSIKAVGDDAFCNCHGLQSVTVPSNVTSIDAHAFGFTEGMSYGVKDGFILYGHKNSVAEKYAYDSGITFITISLSSINVNTPPDKTSYYIGDTFSSSGLTLTATYSNNATQTISADKCTFTGYDMNKASTQTVTVSYTEGGITKSTSFTITVNEKSDPSPTPTPTPSPTTPDNKSTTKSTAKLSSISIKTKPNKTKYSIGQTFSSAGLTITARYSDGTSKTLSAGSCSIRGYNKGKIGTQKITVSYGGKTTSFKISVKGLPKATLINVKSFAGSKISVLIKSVKGINGYECQISTSKTFTKNTLQQKKKTVKFKSILPTFNHKRIYIKCRTYKKVGSKIYYGAWSNIRTTTMK